MKPRKDHPTVKVQQLSNRGGLPDFARIVIEFCDEDQKSKVTAKLADRIWTDIPHMTTIGMTIAGLEPTKGKNLVVTISPPVMADRFMHADIQVQLREYLLTLLEAPKDTRIWVYPDQCWPRVVIHQVPLIQPFLREEDAFNAIMCQLATYNPIIRETPIYMLSRARFLQTFSPEIVDKGSVSLRIPLQDKANVQRLLKQGVFMYGKHLKVTVAGKGRK